MTTALLPAAPAARSPLTEAVDELTRRRSVAAPHEPTDGGELDLQAALHLAHATLLPFADPTAADDGATAAVHGALTLLEAAQRHVAAVQLAGTQDSPAPPL